MLAWLKFMADMPVPSVADIDALPLGQHWRPASNWFQRTNNRPVRGLILFREVEGKRYLIRLK